jgi:hypothetical protein
MVVQAKSLWKLVQTQAESYWHLCPAEVVAQGGVLCQMAAFLPLSLAGVASWWKLGQHQQLHYALTLAQCSSHLVAHLQEVHHCSPNGWECHLPKSDQLMGECCSAMVTGWSDWGWHRGCRLGRMHRAEGIRCLQQMTWQ